MPDKIKSDTKWILILLAISELSHSFLYVTYTIFLLSRGVTLMQVGLLCMICGIAAIVFDIPTGAFADVVGRKKTFMLSCAVWILCSIVYVASNNFWGYALAEVLAALAMSFSSGCVSAHLWDTVTAAGNELGLEQCEIEEHNKSISAKSIWVTSPVSAIGGFVGAKLLEVNTAIPWYGTAIGMVFVIILANFVMKETKERKEVSFAKDIKDMTRNTFDAFRILFSQPEIAQIAATRTTLRVLTVPIFLYWTPYLKEAGGSVTILGFAWILMEIAMSAGVYLCRKLPKKVDTKVTILVLTVIFGASAIFGAVTRSFIPILISILVIEAANMALMYLFGNQTQKQITDLGYGEAGDENNKRATILSSVSTTMSIGGIFGEAGAGYMVFRLGISGSWLIAGSVIIISAVVLYALFGARQKTQLPQEEGAAV